MIYPQALLTGEVVEIGSHDVIAHLTTSPHPSAMPLSTMSLPNSDQLMTLVTQLVENLKAEEMEPLLEESGSDTDEQSLQRSFNVGRRSSFRRESALSLRKSQSLRSLSKPKPDSTKASSISTQPKIHVDTSQVQPPSSIDVLIPLVSVAEVPDADTEGFQSVINLLKASSSTHLLSPATSTTSSQKRKDTTKKMIEKHTIENVKLEASLREQEVAAIRKLLEEAEQKSKEIITEAVEKLREELSVVHEEEKEQIILSE